MISNFAQAGTLNWPRVMTLCDATPRKFTREHSPHHNSFLAQRYIVLHYTGGGSMAGTIDWFNNPESNVSAHFVIDRNGDLAQCVSLDSRAWHCGTSEWMGLRAMNQFAIGIELCNYGPIMRNLEDGLFYPYHAKQKTRAIPFSSIETKTAPLAGSVYCYWEKYPAAQLFTLTLLLHALCRTYLIEDVLAHSEIAPGRKIDPGPAFPLQLIKDFAKISRRLE
jgi:N-acetylmuramoyl-L-alanine amidase